jgi:hypothetical protein
MFGPVIGYVAEDEPATRILSFRAHDGKLNTRQQKAD